MLLFVLPCKSIASVHGNRLVVYNSIYSITCNAFDHLMTKEDEVNLVGGSRWTVDLMQLRSTQGPLRDPSIICIWCVRHTSSFSSTHMMPNPCFSQKRIAPGRKGCVCRYMHCTSDAKAWSRRDVKSDAARPCRRYWGRTKRRSTSTILCGGVEVGKEVSDELIAVDMSWVDSIESLAQVQRVAKEDVEELAVVSLLDDADVQEAGVLVPVVLVPAVLLLLFFWRDVPMGHGRCGKR